MFYSLTRREAEVLKLVVAGYTNIQIGKILNVSVNTVKKHLQNIFEKLNVKNRVQASVITTRYLKNNQTKLFSAA